MRKFQMQNNFNANLALILFEIFQYAKINDPIVKIK